MLGGGKLRKRITRTLETLWHVPGQVYPHVNPQQAAAIDAFMAAPLPGNNTLFMNCAEYEEQALAAGNIMVPYDALPVSLHGDPEGADSTFVDDESVDGLRNM
jgi:hypothetical protein